ncbi:MAG TPA: alpha/beta family hydrolase [Flavisolibacter sp.]
MYPPVPSIKVTIPVYDVHLNGELTVPHQAFAVVVFAHGSGSSMHSPRNKLVANYLNERGMATLLFDLLTSEEDKDYSNRFNIPLLAQRLKAVIQWVVERKECSGMRVGLFGASTGSASALMAAKDLANVIAIVSRGGRPDLVMNILPGIHAATLLIVGGLDTEVIRYNKQAFNQLGGEKRMEIIDGASHLFEEKGALEKVCVLAAGWFESHLQPLELEKGTAINTQ